jgi:hypothetical protein
MALAVAVAAGPDDAIPYPAGFRGWAHVKSQLINQGHPGFKQNGGLHHIYANAKAMDGYRTGRFPDGSVIVAEFLHVQESEGVTSEGARRRIDVMHKDGARFAATGGWGFEQFRGESQTDRMVTAEVAKACFTCHTKQKKQDFVFSKLRR